MFWTDWGSPPKIERASLAGLNRTVLVDLSSSSHYWPNASFVDYTADRIYWIDAWIDAIDSTDLNGNNRRTITNPIHPAQDMHPFDFTVYDDILYWSDWNTDSIERLNWTTAAYLGGLGILTSDRVFGVALLHHSRQPASAGKENLMCCNFHENFSANVLVANMARSFDAKKHLTEFTVLAIYLSVTPDALCYNSREYRRLDHKSHQK